MATIIQAPAVFPPIGKRELFLAGGITNVRDWQRDVMDELTDIDAIIYSPRRENYVHTDEAAVEQIKWEFHALNRASIILFWFVEGDSVQPITLYELGSWAQANKPLLVGVHPTYSRKLDVYTQLSLLRPELEISSSLTDLVSRAKSALT